jgi:putative glutamine amidotransferase
MKRRTQRKSRPEAPLIGITPDTVAGLSEASRNRAEPLLVLQQRYARAIQEAGGVPLILPIVASEAARRRIADAVDGILVSGGNFDIHPKRYGEEPIKALGQIKEERTEFELALISLALERDLPLLGVCGGAQAINVVLGGSLYQDLQSQLASALEHQRGALKDQGGHRVRIHEGTRLKRIVGRKELVVNTTHHQAVKKLGRGLVANATAEDGVIEGLESERHPFVVGVQWHPEFLIHRDACQRKIFSALVSACKKPGD